MKKRQYKLILSRAITMLFLTLALVACSTSQSIEENGEPNPTTETNSPEKEIEDTVEEQETSTETFKVLHITSYHLDWAWSNDQFEGFQDALDGLNIEYKVFEMDTKRRGADEWAAIGVEAQALIEEWQPDLVYTTDDNAQQFVVTSYIDSDIPFVFSGVNAAPESYGFVESANITGVLEQEHFVETVQLLKEAYPEVKRLALVFDEDPMWSPVQERVQEKADQLPDDIEIVAMDSFQSFDGYKEKMLEYQTTVDAVGLIGIFQFKDEDGQNVAYQNVLKWTSENSKLPDFSFWRIRSEAGTLVVVTVSGYEQGLAAGRIAKGILVEGNSPSTYPMEPTVKGEPVISLARANSLDHQIKSTVLLTADVIQEFNWD